MSGRERLKVGSYTPTDKEGKGELIEREFYGQGMIFKDDEAFYDAEHPDRVCYIAELSDATYTRAGILDMCNSQTDIAEEVYEALDWQHPESLIDDWSRSGELAYCKTCKKLFNSGNSTKCPYCGTEQEGSE